LDEAMGGGYHVEHIWPQNPEELPIEGAGDYPSPEERYAAFTDRLGNLTLASGSWNSEWGNSDFETKREEGYEKSKLWVQWEIAENYDEWSIENIEKREQKLIEFILEQWAAPETRLGGIKEPADAIPELTEEEKYVLQALCQHSSGAVRRIVHADACDLPDSPFGDSTDGKERSKVGSILGRLKSVGLAERNKRTWYPSEESKFESIPI
jgi:hypothetical protein